MGMPSEFEEVTCIIFLTKQIFPNRSTLIRITLCVSLKEPLLHDSNEDLIMLIMVIVTKFSVFCKITRGKKTKQNKKMH